MSPSKQERLHSILHELRLKSPHLRGILVANAEGLPVARVMAEGADPNRLAAMAATAMGLGKRMNETMQIGEFSEISISGSNGQVYIYSAGHKGVLAVISPSSMNLGVLHALAKRCAADLARVL